MNSVFISIATIATLSLGAGGVATAAQPSTNASAIEARGFAGVESVRHRMRRRRRLYDPYYYSTSYCRRLAYFARYAHRRPHPSFRGYGAQYLRECTRKRRIYTGPRRQFR